MTSHWAEGPVTVSREPIHDRAIFGASAMKIIRDREGCIKGRVLGLAVCKTLQRNLRRVLEKPKQAGDFIVLPAEDGLYLG